MAPEKVTRKEDQPERNPISLAVSLADVDVVAAGVRQARGQFSTSESAGESEQTAKKPDKQVHRRASARSPRSPR